MSEIQTMLEQMDRYNRLKRESQTEDRATVMAALKACGITKVVIRYDGYGDSGGVEDCQVEEWTSRFINKEFDLQSDCQRYVSTPWTEVFGSVGYISLYGP
ncbi:MAG: DUF6878 family protein [Acetobacter sp.]